MTSRDGQLALTFHKMQYYADCSVVMGIKIMVLADLRYHGRRMCAYRCKVPMPVQFSNPLGIKPYSGVRLAG